LTACPAGVRWLVEQHDALWQNASQSSSRMFIEGRRELFRRGPGLQGFPGRLELGLGRVEVLGRAHREPAGQVDDDVPQPDARYALLGETNPADALPVLEDGIIMRADRTELQLLAGSLYVTFPHRSLTG
jgi:hypothetical protein